MTTRTLIGLVMGKILLLSMLSLLILVLVAGYGAGQFSALQNQVTTTTTSVVTTTLTTTTTRTVTYNNTTTTTATITKTVTSFGMLPAGTALRAVAFKDDFLFQMYINKTAYRYGEPVTVYFNLTYTGQSNRTVDIPYDEFEISIRNATQHNLVGNIITVPYIARHDFSFGKSITGSAVIDGGYIRYNPVGGAAPVAGFRPNNIYLIEGTANGLALTAPPLPITIM